MKKVSLFLITMIIILNISCDNYHKNQEKIRLNEQEDVYDQIIKDYIDNFENYLLFKYDGKDDFYTSSIKQPVEWVKLLNDRPELYNEYIHHLKVEWDSLKRVPVEVTRFEGITDNVLKYKIRIKEIEKLKIKIKKSDNVNVNYKTTEFSDAIN